MLSMETHNDNYHMIYTHAMVLILSPVLCPHIQVTVPKSNRLCKYPGAWL